MRVAAFAKVSCRRARAALVTTLEDFFDER
jgi:hypothetical protein